MIHPALAALPAATITVGDHNTAHFLGMTFNLDTMYESVVAGVITIAFLYWVARKASSGVPNRVQYVVEVVVSATRKQISETVAGEVPVWLVPLGVTLFFFILVCNWLAWIPSGHSPERLGPPTADTNLTYALATVVAGGYIYLGFKRKGGRYVGEWFTAQPAIRRPILLLEQIINPLSLALRLFGNIFAGTIMLAVIALLPFNLFILYGAANIAWKLFDSGFIAPIQAFIFTFLTILYFGFATAEEH
jgi:F-type H+-transporting ATPase subunit a